MTRILQLAKAKVNLTLHVGKAIPDGDYKGYHPVDSLVVFANFGDVLAFEPDASPRFSITGEFAGGLEFESDNLIHRAMKACTAPPHSISLTKNIPVSAGLGGGSANAAAVLRVFDRADTVDEAAMGADIPVCRLSQTALMQGIGERVRPLPGKGRMAAILVNPRISVSTGAIFKAFDSAPREVEPMLSETRGGLLECALAGGNDLQLIAEAQAPIITEVLSAIRQTQDCRLSRMSGSGATCFGLYENFEIAESAAKAIKETHPDWWVRACLLGDAL